MVSIHQISGSRFLSDRQNIRNKKEVIAQNLSSNYCFLLCVWVPNKMIILKAKLWEKGTSNFQNFPLYVSKVVLWVTTWNFTGVKNLEYDLRDNLIGLGRKFKVVLEHGGGRSTKCKTKTINKNENKNKTKETSQVCISLTFHATCTRNSPKQWGLFFVFLWTYPDISNPALHSPQCLHVYWNLSNMVG